jgi:hypothetical protein
VFYKCSILSQCILGVAIVAVEGCAPVPDDVAQVSESVLVESNLLDDGDFDSGTFGRWNTTGGTRLDSTIKRGSYSVNVSGVSSQNTSTLWRDLVVPSTGTTTLLCYARFSAPVGAVGIQSGALLSSTGTTLHTIFSRTSANNPLWRAYTTDLTPYAGTTVRLAFTTNQTAGLLRMTMNIDDCSMTNSEISETDWFGSVELTPTEWTPLQTWSARLTAVDAYYGDYLVAQQISGIRLHWSDGTERLFGAENGYAARRLTFTRSIISVQGWLNPYNNRLMGLRFIESGGQYHDVGRAPDYPSRIYGSLLSTYDLVDIRTSSYQWLSDKTALAGIQIRVRD